MSNSGSTNACAIVMDVHTGEILSMVSLPELRRQRLHEHNAAAVPVAPRRPGQAAAEPLHLVRLPAGQHVQAGHRHRRPSGGRRERRHDHHQQRLHQRPERVRPQHHLRLQGLVGAGHDELLPGRRPVLRRLLLRAGRRLLPERRRAVPRHGRRRRWPATPARTASARPAASTCRTRRRARCRTPTGRRAEIGEDWTIGDTYNMAIGQGFVDDDAAADGARHGRGRQRRRRAGAADRALRSSTRRESRCSRSWPKVASHLPISPDNLAIFREGMRQAVAWGTASTAAVSGVAGGRQDRHGRVRSRPRRRHLRQPCLVHRLRARRRPGGRRRRLPGQRERREERGAAGRPYPQLLLPPQARRRMRAAKVSYVTELRLHTAARGACPGRAGHPSHLQRQPAQLRQRERGHRRTRWPDRSPSPSSAWPRCSPSPASTTGCGATPRKWLYVAALASLVFVLVVGQAVYGSRRWIELAGTQVQPSEMTKLVVVIVLAKYLADRQERIGPACRSS